MWCLRCKNKDREISVSLELFDEQQKPRLTDRRRKRSAWKDLEHLRLNHEHGCGYPIKGPPIKGLNLSLREFVVANSSFRTCMPFYGISGLPLVSLSCVLFHSLVGTVWGSRLWVLHQLSSTHSWIPEPAVLSKTPHLLLNTSNEGVSLALLI